MKTSKRERRMERRNGIVEEPFAHVYYTYLKLT